MIPHSSPCLDQTDLDAILSCVRSSMIAEGTQAAALERDLAQAFDFDFSLAVGSGSQALLLALKAVGVAAGSKVLVPTYVCPEVLGVVEALEAEAILADIGTDYLLDPDDHGLAGIKLDAAIIPSLFGHVADMRSYRGLNCPLVADWAQYLPEQANAERNAFEIAVLSFEATKFLAGGEGGAVLARNPDHIERLAMAKKVGATGFKLNLYPLSDIQASLIRSQLAKADLFAARRREISQRYDEALSSLAKAERFDPGGRFAPFRYAIQIAGDAETVDGVIEKFATRGVAVRRPVSVMLHHLRPAARSFPVADRLFDRTVSLPLYPALTDDEVDHVLMAMKAVLS